MRWCDVEHLFFVPFFLSEAGGRPSLLPLWEKVDRRVSAETDEGCSREHKRVTPLEHPSSVAFGDTFLPQGEKEKRLTNHLDYRHDCGTITVHKAAVGRGESTV